jgi:hypothetical protein
MASFLRVVATVAVLFAPTTPLDAQESFPGLQYILRPGDTVFVTDDTGTVTRGRLAAVGPSTLRLVADGTEREWSAATIRRLERRGDSLKNGIIAGAVSGGLFGFFGLATAGGGGGGEAFPIVASDRDILIALGALTGAGAAIGAGVDALIPGRTLVYQRPSRRAKVVPFVTPTVMAMRLRVAF